MNEQVYETARIEYFTGSKTLVIGEEKIEGVDAILFDESIPIESALLNYQLGDLSINFGAIVIVKPETMVYDTPEGPEAAHIVHLTKKPGTESYPVIMWKQGS
jgi:hypothetical protein